MAMTHCSSSGLHRTRNVAHNSQRSNLGRYSRRSEIAPLDFPAARVNKIVRVQHPINLKRYRRNREERTRHYQHAQVRPLTLKKHVVCEHRVFFSSFLWIAMHCFICNSHCAFVTWSQCFAVLFPYILCAVESCTFFSTEILQSCNYVLDESFFFFYPSLHCTANVQCHDFVCEREKHDKKKNFFFPV